MMADTFIPHSYHIDFHNDVTKKYCKYNKLLIFKIDVDYNANTLIQRSKKS